MLEITLKPIKSQSFNVQINGQTCNIRLNQRGTGLFFDFILNGKPILQGIICRIGFRLIRHKYLGFNGDLFFIDTQGSSDPEYSGLGTRYRLLYSPDL